MFKQLYVHYIICIQFLMKNSKAVTRRVKEKHLLITVKALLYKQDGHCCDNFRGWPC